MPGHPRDPMPPAVHLLALAVFAQGTSEFMLAGLVPDIAADLGVSLADAGLLTSAFAVGMAVGAPLMALLCRRLPPRATLAAFLAVFVLVHVVGALTGSFAVLLATRVAGALANAGFMAVGLTTATALVPADAKGRALSVLLGGTTLACVAGVPGGALLGQLWGWRAAFWAVALVTLPAIAAVLTSVPGTPKGAGSTAADGPQLDARAELRVLRAPRLLVTLLLGALVNGATFCSFTFLAPVITDVAGLGAGAVPGLLALFGIGSFLGVRIGGRFADTRPVPLLAGGGVALAAGWAVFALSAAHPVAVLVLVPVLGTLSFAVGSTLISQVLYAAAGAPTLAGSFATACLNIGAAAGPWLGGVVLAAGPGLRSPLWVSAALVTAALLTAAVAAAARARTTTPPPAAPAPEVRVVPEA